MPKIELNKVRAENAELEAMIRRLRTDFMRLDEVRDTLNPDTYGIEIIRQLDLIKEQILREQWVMKKLADALEKICFLCEKSENRIIDYGESSLEIVKRYSFAYRQFGYLNPILDGIHIE